MSDLSFAKLSKLGGSPSFIASQPQASHEHIDWRSYDDDAPALKAAKDRIGQASVFVWATAKYQMAIKQELLATFEDAMSRSLLNAAG